MKMIKLTALVIVILLSACGSGEVESTANSQPAVIGSLTRSGGLMGKTETLTVYADNTVRVTEGEREGQVMQEASVPTAQVESLEATFASADWQGLDGEYGRQVPDGYAYTITGGGKQVRTFDGASMPPELVSILEQMNALWPAAQPSSTQ